MKGPDFLCIGAIKSGTTWLYENLRRHPDVWLPPIKELRYFNEPEYNLRARLFGEEDAKRYEYWRTQLRSSLRNERTLRRPHHLLWYLNFFFVPRGPRWYASLFLPAAGRVTGDITPLYAPLPEKQIAFVRQHFPHLRIVYVLRDPVDRAWSHILLRCVSLVGWDPRRLTEALVRETIRRREMDDGWLWQNGRYSENLARWERYFPPEQLRVVFYDDLRREPDEFFRGIQRFLGVDEIAPPAARRFNASPERLALPADLERRFSEVYLGELSALEQRFGGVTRDWLARAQTVVGA